MMTIRRRVLVASTATAIASLAIASIAIYLLVRASMVAEFDAGLAARAQVLAALVEFDDESGEYEFHAPDASADDVAYQIRSQQGRVIASQGDAPLLAALAVAIPQSPHAQARQMANGRRIRVLAMAGHVKLEGEHHAAADHQDLVVEVVHDTRLLDRDLWRLALVLIGVASGISIASGLALSVALKAALRPLARLATDIAALDGKSLDRRIDGSMAPGELLPIVGRLNDLLARIENDVRKEKSFNAAIAHELRTPLGGLRSTLEVNLGREGNAVDYRQALLTCHGICLDMNVMVERLLMLSKAEAGQILAALADTDLAAIARDCWNEAREKARLRAARIEGSWSEPVVAHSDPALVRIVLSNLVDNALSHGAEGGVIKIEVAARGDSAIVRMGNAAPGLTAEQATHAFDRFWRADQARTQTGEHYGLGMALCRDLIAILGGTITAGCEAGWFQVEMVLPRRSST